MTALFYSAAKGFRPAFQSSGISESSQLTNFDPSAELEELKTLTKNIVHGHKMNHFMDKKKKVSGMSIIKKQHYY